MKSILRVHILINPFSPNLIKSPVQTNELSAYRPNPKSRMRTPGRSVALPGVRIPLSQPFPSLIVTSLIITYSYRAPQDVPQILHDNRNSSAFPTAVSYMWAKMTLLFLKQHSISALFPLKFYLVKRFIKRISYKNIRFYRDFI